MNKKSDSYPMYCVKCKVVTPSKNIQVKKTNNDRYRMIGVCGKCGINKSKFISSQKGEGLLGKLFGAPGGKIPLLGDLPLIGALF